MTQFEIVNGYYIRNLDERNWILAKTLESKTGRKKEYIEGYYPRLEYAYNAAIEMFLLQSKDISDLECILLRLENLKLKHND